MAHSPTLMTCELSSITNTPVWYIYIGRGRKLNFSSRQRAKILSFSLWNPSCACENDDVVSPRRRRANLNHLLTLETGRLDGSIRREFKAK